jgi:hypothetical protein
MIHMVRTSFALLVAAVLVAARASADEPQPKPPTVGVVSHIQVLSDKVPDVSSIEAWKKSFLKEGMSDQDKALAAWRTAVMFQHQDAPPNEFLQHELTVLDPIKVFNVYGYGFCSMASANVAALARAAGLKARGWGINAHSVPEVYCDGAWRLLDASLINYFPKADGSLASVDEIMTAVKEWHDKNVGLKGNDAKLRAMQAAENWTGWKRGPELLARCPFYDEQGWWPAKTHGWYATMQEYDGSAGKGTKAFLYEYGYSQGYRVNIQLRPGERLTRNWSNRGLHINMKEGDAPGCLKTKTGSDALIYTPKFGDLAPGRIGNGTLEYEVPLNDSAFRASAVHVGNVREDAVRLREPGELSGLTLRMPSSYVYLTGTVTFDAVVGDGGMIDVDFSDTNGGRFTHIARVTASGKKRIDLSPLVLRRYDYQLRFNFYGRGTGLDALKIVHDVQHSQRPLPALDKGDNTITFSAGPPEGTVTVEGATNLAVKQWVEQVPKGPPVDFQMEGIAGVAVKGKQLVYTDFNPQVEGFEKNLFIGSSGKGSITFPVTTPGDLVRLRFGTHYRARDARDGLDYQVSFDGGKTWKTVDRAAGPTPGDCKYVAFEEVPTGLREALVRFAGTSRNATGIFNFRVDADYRELAGGFRPVTVRYAWEEDGKPKHDVRLVRRPQETYTIHCDAKPVMKSITLELAE